MAASGLEPEPVVAPSLPAAGENGPVRGGQSLADSEELVGLGELGLLTSLLQTLGTGVDCDFDDAFSTCQ